MCRNTDVAGSIAGYYYQILLACRELTSNDNNVLEVGIEAGADVRVILVDKQKISIEAKFHKNNIGKYSEDLVKTIYNFYTSDSCKDKSLYFTTNVSPTGPHVNFFVQWNSSLSQEEKERYIKECILRKGIEVNNTYKEKYKQYMTLNHDEEKSLEDFIQKIFDPDNSEYIYEDYAYVNSNITYREFIEKLTFIFEDKTKLDLVFKIREIIKSNILLKGKELNIELNNEEQETILNLLLEKFYISTVENSNAKHTLTFDEIKKISRDEYLQIFKDFKVLELKYINEAWIGELNRILEAEEKKFINDVDQYNGTLKVQLKETYRELEERFFCMLNTKEKYEKVLASYTLNSKGNVQINLINNVLKAISRVTYLLVFNKKNINNMELLLSDAVIDNIRIENILNGCLKGEDHIRDTGAAIGELINEFGNHPNISNGQTFVLNLDFRRWGEPCECEISPEVFNFTQTDENIKDYILFSNMNYKCGRCLALGKDDASTIDYLKEFIECGGIKNVGRIN